jgi:AcrR family transcriptional regulator
MTAKRATYHHGDLRETLLRAAECAIESGGVASVSVRALAQEAGVAHRAAYRHFKDKDALLAAVLTLAYGRLKATIDRRVRASDPRERLVEIAQAYAEQSFAEPQMFLALSGPRVNLSNTADELELALKRAFDPVVDAIREGQAAGLFATDKPEAAAVFFWGSLQGVLSQITYRRIWVKPSMRQRYVEQTARRLIAGLTVCSSG